MVGSENIHTAWKQKAIFKNPQVSAAGPDRLVGCGGAWRDDVIGAVSVVRVFFFPALMFLLPPQSRRLNERRGNPPPTKQRRKKDEKTKTLGEEMRFFYFLRSDPLMML